MVTKIVSGGQTGADRAGLDWAIAHGIGHGGWCPKGRLCEEGTIAPCYDLQETQTADYPERTRRNVRDSDGTVIFTISSHLSQGSLLTLRSAEKMGKPCLHLSRERSIDPAAELRAFVQEYGIRVLNVAGTRASKEPDVGAFVQETLDGAGIV